MKLLILSLFASALVLIFQSCTVNESESDFASLTDSIVMAEKTLMTAWDTMIREDDEKLFDMKRLLEEVSYNPSSDEQRVNELLNSVKQLKESRYTPESITDENIDIYDRTTDSLIRAINKLILETANIQNYPLVYTLQAEIQVFDENTLRMRRDYDICVDEYNRILRMLKTYKGANANKYKNIAEKNVFRLKNADA